MNRKMYNALIIMGFLSIFGFAFYITCNQFLNKDYEWFEKKYNQMGDLKKKIDLNNLDIEMLNDLYKGVDIPLWEDQDKNTYYSLKIEVNELTNIYNQMVEEYNLEMEKNNWEFTDNETTPKDKKVLPRSFKKLNFNISY